MLPKPSFNQLSRSSSGAAAVELAPADMDKNDVFAALAQCPQSVKEWVTYWYSVCEPDNIRICDGTQEEAELLQQILVDDGMMVKLTDPKFKNCWYTATDPADVARVESKTVISTRRKSVTIPSAKEGVDGKLGKWMSSHELESALHERTPGCMKGRTMYIIPFSMGPVGGPLSKAGVQITDSPYVVLSQHVMARVSTDVFNVITQDDNNFVKCFHSIGCPVIDGKPSRELTNNWPCNPEQVIVSHFPERREIISFGSGYGGNSLLGKKCFALRIGSTIAKEEGWLAEHMLISGITNPEGEKKYIAAAFPSACGKTNLAMMEPLLPGWKFECVGDDIAWLKFNEKDGKLYAINPENGFFGVAPGTSMETNPNAMECCYSDTVFTNVAMTVNSKGEKGIWWEGLPMPEDDVDIYTWKGELWDRKTGKAAHPNSRFCTPAANCPVISEDWEAPQGVPIDAVIFGGRRPEGVPLVYQTYDWAHGVMCGASMRSEATAAAEHKGKALMNDPMAMRPFFGYNFGRYLQHWLDMDKPGRKMPEVFHVNWFLKENGKFVWPGFGENVRVLEWIFNRSGDNKLRGNAKETAIGYVPNTINVEGLKEKVDMSALFNNCLTKDFWNDEIAAFRKYLSDQVGRDVPKQVHDEIDALEKRVKFMDK